MSPTPDMPLPPPPPKGPVGQMRFGKLSVTPSFTLGNIGIDTNVYNSQGERKKDFTVSFGPQLRVVYNGNRLTLDGLGFAPYTYYKTFNDQRGFSRGINFHGDYRIGPRLSVYTTDQFAFSKDRPSVEVDTRSGRTASDLSFGVRVGLTRKVDLDLFERQFRTTFDASAYFRGVQLQQTLNEVRRDVGASLSYRVTPYTTLRAIASVQKSRFPLSADKDGSGREYSVGASFNPRALLAGDASIGYRTFKSRSTDQADYTGIVLNGRLVCRLTDSTGISVGMARNLQSSFELAAPYYVNSNYEVAIQQRLGRRFDIGVGDNYYANDYRHFLATSDAAPAHTRPDTVNSYGVSFGVVTPRWGRYSVYVSQWQRRSNDPRNDYKSARVGFLITPSRWLSIGVDSSASTFTSPWANMSNGRYLFTPRL